MDDLILTRLAVELSARLNGHVLDDLRAPLDAEPDCWSLGLAHGTGGTRLTICLRPGSPWIGRPSPASRPRRRRGRRATAAPGALRGLVGARVEQIRKPAGDRRLEFGFLDGRVLVVELGSAVPNMALLDASGEIVHCARTPSGRSAERLARGQPYRPLPTPAGRIVPWGLDASRLQVELEAAARADEPPAVDADLAGALARHVFGLGRLAAGLIVDESRRRGVEVAGVLAERLGQLERAEISPLIEAAADPFDGDTSARADGWTLLPWPRTGSLPAARAEYAGASVAETAGTYYDRLARDRWNTSRVRTLAGLVRRELARVRRGEAALERDLSEAGDAETHRRRGEALLAGLSRARRQGSLVWVPDPYDDDADGLWIPTRPGAKLTDAAEACFAAQRKTLRRIEAAAQRREHLASRRLALEALEAPTAGEFGDVDDLEQAMRKAGIAIGLEREGGGRPVVRAAAARPAGVRMYRSSRGTPILVGRGGRENHRLTFKLAAPEDFWFHAAGVPGAHVVLRNPSRAAKPEPTCLREAAALAAWFSDARGQGGADVQWTRRKYVRRPRGAAAGTVVLKRFATLRVTPELPSGVESGTG